MPIIANKLSALVKKKYIVDRDNNFFKQVPKDDPKDRIEIEVGDSKDPTTVQPQVKLTRWGEVNASFRLKDLIVFNSKREIKHP